MAESAMATTPPNEPQHMPGVVRSLATARASSTIQDGADLVKVLEEQLTRKTKKASYHIRRTSHHVKDSRDNIKVHSWRFPDHEYKRASLPTNARGLFTTKKKDGTHEIVVRGYDKFFNVGEVSHTKWDSIIAKTKPPYDLTLKENGCIIFIGGLEDGTLLVCSKHSTGEREGVLSHAKAGEAHLEKQLSALGKTKEEFARELRERNVTAVAELCDDSFEEHILAYSPEDAGLYLHGVNKNEPIFGTYPSSEVQSFADQWGFRKIGVITMSDVHSVRTFLEEAAKTGSYQGRAVEGFVIRCKMSKHPETLPYQDWFFKYKFDEPYLMYRQWREVTKQIIAGKDPVYKKNKLITGQYIKYARSRLAADPKLGEKFVLNHGIIALRDDFLKFKNLEGSEAAAIQDPESGRQPKAGARLDEVDGNVVLCPVATIGCGKTTCGVALTKLFGWGHLQNDNISGKNRPPRFLESVVSELKSRPVVFADRNNAEKRERAQLIDGLKAVKANAKVVCLNWVHDRGAMNDIRNVTLSRVQNRGDNHQTIKAHSHSQKYEKIMDGFLQRYQACEPWTLPDSKFDLIIDLDPVVDSRVNLDKIIAHLHKWFPKLVPAIPSEENVADAVGYAMTCRVQPQQAERPQKDGATTGNLEYMAVHVDAKAIYASLQQAFDSVDEKTRAFFAQLKQNKRVQDKFHVTLLHRASAKEHPELWKRYTEASEGISGENGKAGECGVILERVVFDDQVMAIVVRLIDSDQKWECANRVAHITVGTRDASIKPKQSNDLLARWLGEGLEGSQLTEVVFEPKPTIQGFVGPVRSRSNPPTKRK
ncbi:hypothetical protein CDD80_185 [Ophiocordyceps camponoti-rufipedis]|uniref:tRNA ligase n=1 Tax=Ophiocordyceps camponoti-rufipedis TaxID=2004952 RepID=A0A2C5ZEH0_9HYPO|nr:hypothetical protein CDD80_185 [Ophiocordyceps camponoti-rufipedis]